jgi:UDP-N-acetylmuramoyl-tripeptide--D-alanyl-D-alanine ligase
MTSFTGKEISAITGGKLLSDFTGNEFCIDSRLVKKGDIFIALPGTTVDGHDFIKAALEAGAGGVIAKFKPDNVETNSPLVLVDDVKAALLKLAKFKRDNLDAKFIAVTGSVGKTSTKEMLKLALSAHGKTFVTLGNYNNDLGVPLCMASIPRDIKYVVLEAGMNNPSEISYLSHLIRPHIAIVTTVAPVHLWTFKDVAGIAREKASIIDGMDPNGFAIINTNSLEFNELQNYIKNKGIKYLSIGPGLDAEILNQEIKNGEMYLKARVFDHFINYKLSHTAQQQIINSLFSLVVCNALNLGLEKAALALWGFKPTKGRGEVIKLANDKILIDDSYNANPASLGAAFENLASYPGRKLAIVADMRELGEESIKLHQQLYQPDLFENFDGIVAMGEMMKHFYDLLPKKLQKGQYESLEVLKSDLNQLTENYDVILVKGSKGTGLYKIIDTFVK